MSGRGVMLNTLSGWRGVFVLAVVIVHSQIKDVDEFVHAGITFFFITSGFLLDRGHRFESLTWRGWLDFVVVRSMRTYPWHWLTTALVMGSRLFWSPSLVRWEGWLPNLLLVHTWIPVRGVFLSLHEVSWFLSAIMFCWVCYPALSWLSGRVRLVTMASWVIAGMAVVTVVNITGDAPRRDFYYVLPALRLVDFTLGMMLSRWCRECLPRHRVWPARRRAAAECLVALSLVVLPMAVHRSPLLDRLSNAPLWWLPDAALVVCCVWFAGHEGPLGRLMGHRLLAWTGRVSLEIYLLHYFVAININYTVMPLLGHFGCPMYEYHVVFTLPLTLLAAALAHRLFTRPLWRLASRVQATRVNP